MKDIVFSADYLVLGLGGVYLGAPVAAPLDPRHRLVTTKYNPARLFRDIHALQSCCHRTQRLPQDAVLALPTAGGTFTRAQVRQAPIRTNSLMGLYTNHCNLLNLAAIAVPENGRDLDDPFGITIFARHDAEHLAFGTAAA